MTVATEFVVVGVLMRVEQSTRSTVEASLQQLPGVTTFEVGDPYKLGALIESPTLEAAKEVLLGQIETMPGVLGAWPVFAHEEDGLPLVELQLDGGASRERSEAS